MKMENCENVRVVIASPISRSGSTFLRNVLNAHPDVFITNEARLYLNRPWTEHFHNALAEIKKYPRPHPELLEKAYLKTEAGLRPFSRWESSSYVTLPSVRNIEDALFGHKYTVIGDKGMTPYQLSSFWRFDGDVSSFPVRVIYVYRDPRDVFASLARHKKDYPYHPVWSDDFARHAIRWEGCMYLWSLLKKEERFPCLEIKHEDFLDNPQLEKICEFLGLDSFELTERFFEQRVKPYELMERYFKRNVEPHVGYWKETYPDMEKEFHPSMIETMRRWGYD